MEIILVLLALVGWVINVNGWFVIPELVITVLFGLGVGIFVAKLIILITATRKSRKQFKNFRKQKGDRKWQMK